MTTATLILRVISLKELYQQHLSIPDYQRPYKWTEKHVRTLFDDLDYFVAGITVKNRDDERYKYRLGTIVLHKPTLIIRPNKHTDYYQYPIQKFIQRKLPNVNNIPVNKPPLIAVFQLGLPLVKNLNNTVNQAVTIAIYKN